MNLSKTFRAVSVCALFGTAMLSTSTAQAQSADADKVAAYVPEDEIKTSDLDDRRELDGALSVNGNVNLVQNDSVVGQVDGLSILFGLGIKGGLDWINGRHELRNTLTIDESWARTPVIDEFQKNNDEISLENLYNYFFLKWAGAFGRLNASTALLPTTDLRSEEVTYLITRNDGSVDTLSDLSRLELADSFSPFSLYQSLGLFAEPIQKPAFALSVRLGAGARETFADGVLIIEDNDETLEIEVTELDNVYQGGGEAFLGVRGKAYEDRLSYEVGGSVLMPFLNNDDQNRSATELTRYALTAAFNFSVFSWMGLTYKAKVISDPQLLDDVQVQNSLLLSFSYSFIERGGGPQLSPTEELEKARSEAEEARAKAEEAEGKVRAAERRVEDAEKAAKAKEAAEDAKEAGEEAVEEFEEEEGDSEETPESPETPEGSDTPETPEGSDTPETPEGSDAPE